MSQSAPMASPSLSKKWIGLSGVLCLLFALLYFLLYGRHGYSDTDHGFIPALAWRVLQGQIPYRDFIYVRPPLSPLLHMPFLLLPQAILWGRLFFYLQMGVITWLSTWLFLRHFAYLRSLGAILWFSLAAFVLSVHNFPAMPWHSIDGLFFAVLGLFFLSYAKRLPLLALGIFCCVLSALAKQAFYPVPLLGLLFLGCYYGKKQAIYGSALLLLQVSLIGLGVEALYPGLLAQFWTQSSAASSLTDLWQVGVMRYLKPAVLISFPLLLVGFFIQSSRIGKQLRPLAWYFYMLILLGLLFLHLCRSLFLQAYVPPSMGMAQAFWSTALVLSLYHLWKAPSYSQQQAHVLLIAMLAIAWCVSISWGYTNPMLYFTPILFANIVALHSYGLSPSLSNWKYGLFALACAFLFAFMHILPYRDLPRFSPYHPLGKLTPKLGGVYSGAYQYQKNRELFTFAEKYKAYTLTVLPAMPLAAYLLDQPALLPVDWAHNAELAYQLDDERLAQYLSQPSLLFLIEKDKYDRIFEAGRYGSKLSLLVLEHGTRIDTGTHFEVYTYPQRPLSKR